MLRLSLAVAALSAALTTSVAAQTPCEPDLETLCFLEGRLAVDVNWTDPGTGESRRARAFPIKDDTGSFWFFDDDNLEVIVKVLDGSAITGSPWVFLASLSNLEFFVHVTDRFAARQRTWHNPRGTSGASPRSRSSTTSWARARSAAASARRAR